MSTASAEVTGPKFEPEEATDSIPFLLLFGIFAGIAFLIAFLMAPTWKVDWNFYQKSKYLAQGKPKEAIPHLQWLLASNTPAESEMHDSAKSPTYLSELALCYVETGDYENGEKYYRLAQQYNRNFAQDDAGSQRDATDFTTEIGVAQLKRGDVAGAEKTLAEALKRNKLDYKANYYMAEIEMKRANYVKAASYYKVVARVPQYEQLVKDRYAEIEKLLFAPVK